MLIPFPKDIRLEFELAYHDTAAQRFNHYTTMTPIHSSVYSCRTYKYCGMDGLVSPADSQFLPSLVQAIVDRSKWIIRNWYHYQPRVQGSLLVIC